METGNQSHVTEFILLGFSITPQVGKVLFVIFLVIFLFTLISNGLIITVVHIDSQLHSPMYYFISNLSFLDICFLSTTIPKCLQGFVSERNIITFSGCTAQMYIGLSLGVTQGILLAVMSWDRFVAICNPLNYQRVMNKTMCLRLSLFTWTSGFLLTVLPVCATMTAPFCGRNKINHAACEIAALLRLTCGDRRFSEAITSVSCVVAIVAPLSLIIFTYFRIITTILRMPTAVSRHKAFSTCGSHLVVVSIFYGACIVMYLRPRSAISDEKDKVTSLSYGLITPALNPLIYTLRNKDVKGAVKKRLCRKMVCCGFEPRHLR